MADDLFSPTISAPPDTARPWSLGSLVYPAFFGGPLAAAVLGVINGRRLGLAAGPLLGLAALGLAGVAGRMLALLASAQASVPVSGVIRAALGLAVFGVVMLSQRRRYRAFELRGGEPVSLVWPGTAVAATAIVADFLLVELMTLN